MKKIYTAVGLENELISRCGKIKYLGLNSDKTNLDASSSSRKITDDDSENLLIKTLLPNKIILKPIYTYGSQL